MFIELLDLLRCPRDHEETWLVAALNAVQDRFVIKAKLGCPVCGASYSISNGIADLRTQPGDRLMQDVDVETGAEMRIAGLLNLVRPGAVVVLEGKDAAVAQRVADLTETKVVAVNPISEISESETVAMILCDVRLPFASSSVTGAACGSPTLIGDVPRVLINGGRALLPVEAEVPAGLNELMRDDRQILAESVGSFVGITTRR